MVCKTCGKRFAQRIFDAEMQLLAAGWSKAGDAWVCVTCAAPKGPPPRVKPVTTCLECKASFGVAFASDEQKLAKGWQPMGDRWVCPRCAQKIRSENG